MAKGYNLCYVPPETNIHTHMHTRGLDVVLECVFVVSVVVHMLLNIHVYICMFDVYVHMCARVCMCTRVFV